MDPSGLAGGWTPQRQRAVVVGSGIRSRPTQLHPPPPPQASPPHIRTPPEPHPVRRHTCTEHTQVREAGSTHPQTDPFDTPPPPPVSCRWRAQARGCGRRVHAGGAGVGCKLGGCRRWVRGAQAGGAGGGCGRGAQTGAQAVGAGRGCRRGAQAGGVSGGCKRGVQAQGVCGGRRRGGGGAWGTRWGA